MKDFRKEAEDFIEELDAQDKWNPSLLGLKETVDQLVVLLQQTYLSALEDAAKVIDEWARRRCLQFGHEGTHNGVGSKECPKDRHHHHDFYCESPVKSIRALGEK